MTLDDFWEFITTQCYMEKIGGEFYLVIIIRELKLNEIVLKYDPNTKDLEIKRIK